MLRMSDGQTELKAELRLPWELVDAAVAAALAEDLGVAGDITSEAIIPATARAAGVIATRKAGVVAGVQFAQAAFTALDKGVRVKVLITDGGRIEPGDIIARVSGNARALLGAERVALNFLGHLSGIATLTRAFVDRIAGTRARIIDTRKTTPGLRAFEKHAVRAGGGFNHRFGLFDAILIKDNHIAAAGGIAAAMAGIRGRAGHMVKVEVEVTTLAELDEALAHSPDAVLLDNMSVPMLKAAVDRVAGRTVTEASGGVTLDTVRQIAETGVDLISVGALTHSAPNLDVGLDFDAAG
jgi:nicotinate-nucleotide pyrophosphorylase (carboxylating)